MCILEELDDSHFKCSDCVQNMNQDCAILMVTRSRVKEDIVNSMSVQEINQTASKERTELIKISEEKGISQ